MTKKTRIMFAFQPTGVQNVTADNKYGIDPKLIELGWSDYVAEVVLSEIEWMEASGLKGRVVCHNPFCAREGEAYQFDQFIHAKNAGLITTQNFAQAWRPIVARAECMFYLGTVRGDLDFEKRKRATRSDDYLRRVLDSVAPILDLGASVGFDASHDYPVGSIEYETLDTIRAMLNQHGGDAYIEPLPHKDAPQMASWHSITQETLYQNRIDSWATPIDQITGEIIRWPTYPIGGWGSVEHNAMGLLPIFKSILSDGHTACGATEWFRLWGMSASEVLES